MAVVQRVGRVHCVRVVGYYGRATTQKPSCQRHHSCPLCLCLSACVVCLCTTLSPGRYHKPQAPWWGYMFLNPCSSAVGVEVMSGRGGHEGSSSNRHKVLSVTVHTRTCTSTSHSLTHNSPPPPTHRTYTTNCTLTLSCPPDL